MHYICFTLLYGMTVLTAQKVKGSLGGILFLTAVLLFIGVRILKADWGVSVLAAVLVSGIIQLSYCLLNSVTGILSPFFHELGMRTAYFGWMILSALLSLLINFLINFLICQYFSIDEYGENKYFLMILVPLLMIFLMSEYMNQTVYGRVVTVDEQGKMLGAVHSQMLLLELFCVASIFCFLYAYRRCMLSFALDYKMSMLEQESSYQKKYVKEARLRYEKTSSFRHDIRNHFVVIGGTVFFFWNRQPSA